MENRHLERQSDNIKSSIDSLITDLISEIEEKESIISQMTDKIESLEEELDELKDLT